MESLNDFLNRFPLTKRTIRNGILCAIYLFSTFLFSHIPVLISLVEGTSPIGFTTPYRPNEVLPVLTEVFMLLVIKRILNKRFFYDKVDRLLTFYVLSKVIILLVLLIFPSIIEVPYFQFATKYLIGSIFLLIGWKLFSGDLDSHLYRTRIIFSLGVLLMGGTILATNGNASEMPDEQDANLFLRYSAIISYVLYTLGGTIMLVGAYFDKRATALID